MKTRRFFAGIIDRMAILSIFIGIVFCVYGLFASAGYLGRYTRGCVMGRPSTYNSIDNPYISVSANNDNVSTYYQAQKRLAMEEHGNMDLSTLDYKLTCIFLISNFIYLSIVGVVNKRTLGELMLGIDCVSSSGKSITRYHIVIRIIVYMVVILIMIGVRYLLDSTYLNASIILLLMNWLSIFSIEKSIVDTLSFSKITK